ncbi:MAG: vWA domain-containing protein [Acidobacteriota bacterium]
MTKPGSVVQIVDCSGSMRDPSNDGRNTKLQLAQADTDVFIVIEYHVSKNTRQYGQVGIVRFSTDASDVYGLHTLDGSGTVKHAAIKVVNELTADGWTNITAGIANGHAMLAHVDTTTYNRGMVLFSDGEWNRGGDPTVNLPTDIPIYAIGYGSSSQLSYLRTIASRTGGKYHVTGNPGVLKTFYTDITGATQVATPIANLAWDADSYDFTQTTAEISAGASTAVFSASWNANEWNYVDTTPVTGQKQISVRLRDPNGQLVTPSEVDAPTGSGYAVLVVDNPMAGTWTLTLRTADLPVPTVGSALGAFCPPDGLQMELESKPHNPFHIRARVTDQEQPVTDLQVEAYAVHPIHSHQELLAAHRAEVTAIIDANDFDADVDKEAAALSILDRQRPELRLFRNGRLPAMVEATGDAYDVHVDPAKPGVEHTVYVIARGRSPVSDKTFQRTRLITVV